MVLEEDVELLRELLGLCEEVFLTVFVIRIVPEGHTELVEVFVVAEEADLVPHPVEDFEEEAELVNEADEVDDLVEEELLVEVELNVECAEDVELIV